MQMMHSTTSQKQTSTAMVDNEGGTDLCRCISASFACLFTALLWVVTDGSLFFFIEVRQPEA